MIRAAIYTRFSTDKQSEASLADQERICRIRAAAQCWEVVAVHGDDGVSGSTPVAARAGGRGLLADALAGRFDVLLLEGLDRLSRDLVESERVVRRLEHRGIRIVGVADGYDTGAAGGKLMRGMKAVFSEHLLDDIRAKTHRGLAGRVARGMHAGGLSYERDLPGIPPLVVLQLGEHALPQRSRVDRTAAATPHHRASKTACATRSGVIAAIASRQCSQGIRQPQASPGAASSSWQARS